MLCNIAHGQITSFYVQHIHLITKIMIVFPNHDLNIITIALMFHCNFFKYCQLLFAQVNFNDV